MERKTVAKWLLVAALACLGLFVVAGVASAQEGTTVQGSQSSTDAEASTGAAEGANSSAFIGGPSAVGDTGAASSQLGKNTATVSQKGSAKSGDPVAGGQVTGVVGGNATIQNQNFADAPVAESGEAILTNDLETNMGPGAEAGDTAQVSQFGDNTLDATQEGTAESGDAVSGAQVTGVVGGGEHTVQNQNTALEADSLSGDVEVLNTAANSAGPFAEADITAQTGQVGDNDAVLSQSSEANTGDALSGAGVTGLVGGSATVQNQNTSDGSTSETGSAVAENDLAGVLNAVAGPSAAAETAQATQKGNNSVDATQHVDAGSGDALSGSQVTGAVGDEGGFFTVQNQQASTDDESLTGDAEVLNVLELDAGPEATDADVAFASQLGDNDVTTAQAVEAGTGDALSGAQVLGDVGHEDVTAQQSNYADTPLSETGSIIDASNTLDVTAGPGAELGNASQVGDNSASAEQGAIVATGDAVSGGQIVGAVPSGSEVTIQGQNTSLDAEAITGDVDVEVFNESLVFAGVLSFGDLAGQATQNGDNAVALVQAVAASSGDAVAGGQVTGVVDDGGVDLTIQNQNDSEGSIAESGIVAGDTNVAEATGGVFAEGDVAAASQLGDNTVSADQTVGVESGDAVAGGQVTGAVTGGGSDIAIQNQNNSDGDESVTGDVDIGGNLFAFGAGPSAAGLDSSQASQVGDNAADSAQTLGVSSGDAVTGSQVTGVVGGDSTELDIQNSNFSADALSTSGEAILDGANTLEPIGNTIGPDAGVDADVAQATQNGDNTVALDQNAAVATGDALGAAQVTGAVLGSRSDATIQNQNACIDCAVVESGSVDAGEGNLAELVGVGPFAEAGDSASASQVGDNAVAADQALTAASGDAVAGGQVTGAVAGAGSTVTPQLQNSSLESEATTGDVDGAFNTLDVGAVGPAALADVAQASQVGDDSLAFTQDVTAASGDAVAGSQVTGIVGPEDSEIQVQNADDASLGVTGDVDAANEAAGSLTPTAEGDTTGHASLNGDSEFNGDQALSTESGDAVGGSQINGVVGGSGAVGSASRSASNVLGDVTGLPTAA